MTGRLRRHWRPVATAGAAALAVAGLGALMTDLSPWYYGLEQPSWKPPDWLFGPAWTLIFALCAIAGCRAWIGMASQRLREWMLAAFAANACLNMLWSLLFFRLQRPDLALYEVALLWLSILVLIGILGRHSWANAALLLPYLLWVSFASILNLAVVQLNGPF
ncbi:MAG: tryptophan-rich sensory protein [Gammaproteobacteria bacterium]|nr:tryptophan-rich sensory protein [Gammaproteobacteria bacterium]